MSTNVTGFELFCVRQVARIRGISPITFGATGRMKRNRTLSERISSKEWARFTYNTYKKMSGTK